VPLDYELHRYFSVLHPTSKVTHDSRQGLGGAGVGLFLLPGWLGFGKNQQVRCWLNSFP
jgi:hypothetical protein